MPDWPAALQNCNLTGGNLDRIPSRFRADVIARLGHGGEATVYELTGDRVLRVFHKEPDNAITQVIAPFY